MAANIYNEENPGVLNRLNIVGECKQQAIGSTVTIK